MEGGNLQLAGLRCRQQFADAFLHFPGRLVGERDGGNVAGLQTAVVYEVGDFLRNDAGFPRTGTGQYQQGSVQVLDGGALLWVESVHVRNERRQK